MQHREPPFTSEEINPLSFENKIFLLLFTCPSTDTQELLCVAALTCLGSYFCGALQRVGEGVLESTGEFWPGSAHRCTGTGVPVPWPCCPMSGGQPALLRAPCSGHTATLSPGSSPCLRQPVLLGRVIRKAQSDHRGPHTPFHQPQSPARCRGFSAMLRQARPSKLHFQELRTLQQVVGAIGSASTHPCAASLTCGHQGTL